MQQWGNIGQTAHSRQRNESKTTSIRGQDFKMTLHLNNRLSDTVIIIICVGGVVFIIAVVLLLILCITSKHKDTIRTIHPTPRRHLHIHVRQEARSRRAELPKPPPYSELPPSYPDWSDYDVLDVEPTNQSMPSSSRGLRRTESIRVRIGSPQPSTSARSRPNPESPGVRDPVSTSGAGNIHVHREASFILDTRRNEHNHTSDNHHDGQRDFRQVHGTRPNNQSAIVNPLSDSYTSNPTQSSPVNHRSRDLLPGEVGSPDSPPPANTAAAIRQEQRRRALQTLNKRRLQIMTPSPPPRYEQYGNSSRV